MWEEDGKLPDVVIELPSSTTEHIDRGAKKQIYESIWRLPEYFIFDPETKVLEGWRLVGGRYTPIESHDGELECRVLGLRLGVRAGVFQRESTAWLRWIDPITGKVLPTDAERADQERARANDATARADALAAEVARLRG